MILSSLLLLAVRRNAKRAGRSHRRNQPGPTAAELEPQASQMLVATDDAVRTSEQELGFAMARLGEHAAAPFSAALKSAQAELSAAFKLRQWLDDNPRAAESARRSKLTEICAHCAEANRVLDDHSGAFDQLQDLQVRAAAVLAEVAAHASQQATRLGHSRQMLEQLAARYTPQAIQTVTISPDQAAERLEFATRSLSGAVQQLAADEVGPAAVFLQAAEAAADQASDLLDGVEHLEAELTQAASALPAALREIDAEIADASALLASRPGDGQARHRRDGRAKRDSDGQATGPGGGEAARNGDGLASSLARAESFAATVRDQLATGPFDALAALRAIEHADSALDHFLAESRTERDRQDRARAVLDQAMLLARSSVTGAADFITTRRGAIGAPARTRLAEAQRHFERAIARGQDDPETALAEAERCDALAQQARTLADDDVASLPSWRPGVVTGGAGPGAGLDGAILGGILIGGVPGSARGGAGDSGDSAPGKMLRPASFGGVGTRGRSSIAAGFTVRGLPLS